ncbi:NADH-cytochrome b5 reductase 1 [Fusarium euwallaceae]|uniref:NADH-cytochrome b5 reductase 1 n=1 Tax=Fusarium euwallaceae TaxID=1147111 RepID=A0A430L4H2_9HYPO|nr:NADH-cytochrome b5 reductase 1 [Fusarium euwallaceae]
MAPVFSHSDVQLHNTKDDLYLIIRGKVYNASSFVDDHPGGSDILLEVAGKDATEAYNDTSHSDEADEILEDLQVGILSSDSNSAPQGVNQPATPQEPAARVTTKVLQPDHFQEFKLLEKNKVSHNVAIYRFNLPNPESILGLPIGQHISISAQITQPDGTSKEVTRSYTPISGDDQPGCFDMLIKSYPQGNISRYIDTLIPGQTIRIRGPKGCFVYTPNMVRHFGMIAGGTGITPMLQIINAIVRGRASGDTTEVDLIFANVNSEDILLKERLDALAKVDSGIRIHYVLNNPPAGWTGGVGFVRAEMVTKWLPKPGNDIKILLCGPPPMVSAMKKITESLGYNAARPASKLEDQVFAF